MPSHYHELAIYKIGVDGSGDYCARTPGAIMYNSSDNSLKDKNGVFGDRTVGNQYSGQQNMNSVGGNSGHNNLQPYITVYMWKRTA